MEGKFAVLGKITIEYWVLKKINVRASTAIKGTLMQIIKISWGACVHIKNCPEKFAFIILRFFELYDRKFWKMFVYKHGETIEYVKN